MEIGRLTAREANTVHDNAISCTHFFGPECMEREGVCTDFCPWEEAVWETVAALEDILYGPDGTQRITMDRLKELAEAETKAQEGADHGRDR